MKYTFNTSYRFRIISFVLACLILNALICLILLSLYLTISYSTQDELNNSNFGEFFTGLKQQRKLRATQQCWYLEDTFMLLC